MFDKFRRKSRSKRDSSIDTSTSTDKHNLATQRSRATSTSSSSYNRRSSAPTMDAHRSVSRGRSGSQGYAVTPSVSAQSPRTSGSRKPRWRDMLWKNSLWDQDGGYPEGPRVRAMSQSVDRPHPEVAEERMRAMYPQWRA